MRIGIIDADLIGRKKHRFPNLASMKISSYHKYAGDDVSLLLDYSNLSNYDKVYVSKAFTDTVVPEDVVRAENVVCGGTGFFYDKAPPLPPEVEHIMPDYHLYDGWVNRQIQNGANRNNFSYPWRNGVSQLLPSLFDIERGYVWMQTRTKPLPRRKRSGNSAWTAAAEAATK